MTVAVVDAAAVPGEDVVIDVSIIGIGIPGIVPVVDVEVVAVDVTARSLRLACTRVLVLAVVPVVSVAAVSVVDVCVCAATMSRSIKMFRMTGRSSKLQAASGNSSGSPSHQQMQNQIFASLVRR